MLESHDLAPAPSGLALLIGERMEVVGEEKGQEHKAVHCVLDWDRGTTREGSWPTSSTAETGIMISLSVFVL